MSQHRQIIPRFMGRSNNRLILKVVNLAIRVQVPALPLNRMSLISGLNIQNKW